MIYTYTRNKFPFIKHPSFEAIFITEKLEAFDNGIEATFEMSIRYRGILRSEMVTVKVDNSEFLDELDIFFNDKDDYQRIINTKEKSFMVTLEFEAKILLIKFLNIFNRKFKIFLDEKDAWINKLEVTKENELKILRLNSKFTNALTLDVRSFERKNKPLKFGICLYENK